MKRYLPLLAFYLLTNTNSLFATHMMGGEITWACLSQGGYIFQMKIYRDCNGSPGPTSAILHTDAPGFTTGIALHLVSQIDNSPVCNANGPHITCDSATGNSTGAVEEFIFRSGSVTLTGVPPSNGWAFWWNICCRNNAIANLANPGSVAMTLRAKMYSYNGRNAYPCYDSSPHFSEPPRPIICSGYPFTMNNNAVDNDLDSLVYNWDYPLNDNLSGTLFNALPIPFESSYSYDSPLPDSSKNPNNVAAILDNNSGEISFTSYTAGTYVLAIKVTAFKCGQKVAEVYRDIQAVLFPCVQILPGSPNHPPLLTPPFLDTNFLHTLFTDTIHAGDTVSFSLSGQDLDADPNFIFQYLHLIASGIEFDSSYTNAQGNCPFPPCATLNPSPIGYSPMINYATDFNWHTSCDLLQKINCSLIPSALLILLFMMTSARFRE